MEEVWEGHESNEEQDNEIDSVPDVGNETCSDIIAALSFFILLWQRCFSVSGVAISAVLKFFKMIFVMIGDLTGLELVKTIGNQFPTSLKTIKKLLGVNGNEFRTCAVCPKCNAIYEKQSCTKTLPDGRVVSRTCTNVEWPNHPRKDNQSPCGEKLMKKVRGKTGTIFWYPRKVAVFQSLFSSLKRIFNSQNFQEKCELWRNEDDSNGEMRDIYDGKVWRDFQNFDGKPFLSQKHNYALLLNVDWFNPFKHSPGSIGAVYCVFANLPRNERYKRENILLLALIEGEPKHDMNTILKPIVDELITLWKGHRFWIKLKSTLVRVALLCVACDIPAARKVAGFLSHNARLGCSRCLKEFPVNAFGERPDYSGFERNSWPKRNADQHRTHAFQTLQATSESKRKQMERTFGCRYTELLRLPYYDSVRFVIIDPMHNLLLGTAKHMFKTWTDKGILKPQNLKDIQEHIDSVVVPPDVGRIPNKLEAGTSGMTADQWKNWTLIYSPYILSKFLPKDHYDCWMLFVSACAILCGRTISISKLEKADKLLLSFCKSAQNLYGKDCITPNMHLHCHLVECIIDYGPVYAFWCFSFERYNGILGTYQHNNKAIPVQMMRKFLEDECLAASNHASSPIFTKYFKDILPNKDEQLSGTLQQIFNGNVSNRDFFTSVNPRDVIWNDDPSKFHPHPPMRTMVMDDGNYEDLCLLVQAT
mgnify:CR=1 FL=1